MPSCISSRPISTVLLASAFDRRCPHEPTNAADWALMTIVQATCPTCGDVEVYACDITVRC